MKGTIELLHQEAAVRGVHNSTIGDTALLVLALTRAIVADAHVTTDDFAVFGDADAFGD